jgi:tryptophan-rich sensory protein
MISDRWIEIGVAALSVTMVAFAGGILTEVGPWYELLRFPPYRPPNWVFGPAWSLIFLCVATSGIIAWEHAPDASAKTILIILLAVNAVFNVAWSALFFKLRRPDWALIEVVGLWLSILALVIFIGSFSKLGGELMLPYLLWVSFASFLNLRVVQLNAPFGVSR